MKVDMTGARKKLALAMEAALEVIRQLNQLTTTPKRMSADFNDAKKKYTSVVDNLEELYREWLHAMQAVGNSEDERGQSEITSKRDEVVIISRRLEEAWTLVERKISVEKENKA